MKEALVAQRSELEEPEPQSISMPQGNRVARHLQTEKDPRSSFKDTNDTGPFVVTDLLLGTSYQVTCVGPSYELRLPIQHSNAVVLVEVGTDVVDVAERLMQSSSPLASQA
jgi:hypothetical protein